MAMNTTVNTGNIAPVGQGNPTIKSNPRVVTNESYTPFQPETQVELESSIKSMLSSLEKTVMGKGLPTQGLPEEVQKMVETLMKNAFSLDMSLSQGLSDVLQSQKFTIDQLNLLSKFLEQIGTLLENNDINKLPDSLKTLLGNMNLLLGEDGKVFDGMVLNKLAFQLLEGKDIKDLPEVLQFLLMNNTSMPPSSMPQSTELNFLKQLVQFFMPKPSTAEGAPTNANKPNNNPANGNQQAAQNTGATNQQGATQPAGPNTAANGNASAVGQGQQTGTTQQPAQNANPQQSTTAQSNSSLQQNTAGKQQNANDVQPVTTNRPEGQNAAKTTNQPQQPPNVNDKNQVPLREKYAAAARDGNTVQQMSLSNKPPLQNTMQTMQVMKTLAGQLLPNNNLTENEVNLLKNFINGNQTVLNDKEVKQLQTLIRISEENIPASVRQAAMKQDLPNLTKLWAFVQLCNLTKLLDLQVNRLRSASKDINDFTSVLKRSMHNENEVAGNQRSMSFMTPLYLGDNEKCYPTYIHVYDESANKGEADEAKKETWLRICLLTENIGAVELVFRLYEKNNVNLRVAFSEREIVDSFNEYVPELRTAFDELPLILNEIKVSAIGE